MPEATERIAGLEAREKELLKKIDEMSDRLKSLENRRLLYEMIGAAVVVGIFIAFGWEPRSIARNVANEVATTVARDTATKVADDEGTKVAHNVMQRALREASKQVRDAVPSIVTKAVKKELGISTIAEIDRIQKEAAKTLAEATAARDAVQKRLDDLAKNRLVDVDEIVARKITAREELETSAFKTAGGAVTIHDDKDSAGVAIKGFEGFGIFHSIDKAKQTASIVMSRPDKLNSSGEPPGIRFRIENKDELSYPSFDMTSGVLNKGNKFSLNVAEGNFSRRLDGEQKPKSVEFK